MQMDYGQIWVPLGEKLKDFKITKYGKKWDGEIKENWSLRLWSWKNDGVIDRHGIQQEYPFEGGGKWGVKHIEIPVFREEKEKGGVDVKEHDW